MRRSCIRLVVGCDKLKLWKYPNESTLDLKEVLLKKFSNDGMKQLRKQAEMLLFEEASSCFDCCFLLAFHGE